MLCMYESALAITYVLGDKLYTYSTQAQSSKGGSYVDSTYNTTITRITNSSPDRGAWGTSTGYSTWNPLSSDGSHLIFMNLSDVSDGGPYVCYNASDNSYNPTISGYFNTYLNWDNGNDPEPRWDESGSHPSWIYHRTNMQLRRLDVSTGTDSLVHDFSTDFSGAYSSGYYILNGEEGSPSLDSRYWGFMVKKTSSGAVPIVFTYDKTTNAVIAYHTAASTPDSVLMSQSGAYIHVNYDYTGSGGEGDGPHVYTSDFTSNHKVCSAAPHIVWAYDAQGKEVLFYMDGDYVSFTRADTGTQYKLYYQGDLGWNSNCLHSAPNSSKKGWGIISTYVGSNTNWDYNQIFAVELDETKVYGGSTLPRIWRLTFTQNQVNMNHYYFEQPNAQMSRDGTKIWWGANWRNDASGNMEVYRVDLPSSWWNDLNGISSTLMIGTATLASGSLGAAYSQTLTCSGGTLPYTWSISSGTLPTGLSLNNSSGIISGTPTVVGPFSFTVQVADSASATATKSLNLTITVGTTTSKCDVNGDGSVNILDFQAIAAAIVASSNPSNCDINNDGVVNTLDLQLMGNIVAGNAVCPN